MKRNFKDKLKYKLVFTFFLAFFALLYTDNVKGEKVNSIVAIVNEEIITNFDVLRRTAIALQQAKGTFNEADIGRKKLEFYKEAIEELIDREVLVQTAQTALMNDEIKMDEIEKNLDSFIKGAAEEVNSLAKFYEIVSQQGMDPLEKKRELRDDLMVEKILKVNVYRKVNVRPKDSKNYYNNHLSEFYTESQVTFRQILIKFSEYEDRASARKAAEEVMTKLNNSEFFTFLAKQYSNGPHAENGGLWSGEEVNDVRKDLRDIIFTLKEGELSDVIESSVGYHIIRCEENKPESVTPFKDVQDEIHQKIFREKFAVEKKKYVDELKKKFYIKQY